MYRCEKCQKDVVVKAVSSEDEDLSALKEQLKAENKILIVNPNPFKRFTCPECNTEIKTEREIQE